MSAPNVYARLPAGPANHPRECVCRLHEQGIWAGCNPLGGALVLPDSPLGRQARERLERRFRLRFTASLGPHEWTLKVQQHRELLEAEQEARWRRGLSTPAERSTTRFQAGVRLGRWPAPVPTRAEAEPAPAS